MTLAIASFLTSARHRPPAAGRLASCRRGLASLEFALVAAPLLMTVFGFISLSAVFFTMTAMQVSAQLSARLVSTGQVTSFSGKQVSCSASLSSTQAEYYACSGLPTWAAFSVTTAEDCTVPSVTVTISTSGSAAAIADMMRLFTAKTISATSVVMKEGLCP